MEGLSIKELVIIFKTVKIKTTAEEGQVYRNGQVGRVVRTSGFFQGFPNQFFEFAFQMKWCRREDPFN